MDGKRLEAVVDDGDRTQLEYDVNGNVSSETRFGSDGQFLSTSVYEYTATDLAVPNISLFEIVYEFDQL